MLVSIFSGNFSVITKFNIYSTKLYIFNSINLINFDCLKFYMYCVYN